jgi:alpha-L-fucosidase
MTWATAMLPHMVIPLFKEIGDWLKRNGVSLYGTRGGPFISDENFASTCKGNTIYLHLLNGRKQVVLPTMPAAIQSVSILNGGPITLGQKDGHHVIRIDEKTADPMNTILVVKLDRSAESMKPTAILKGE